MQRSFRHEYASDDDHCREAVLDSLPGDLPASLTAAVASYRRGGTLEEIEAVLERLDASEHGQRAHDACVALGELLHLHLHACSCQEEEWYAFQNLLEASLRRYGDPGWAVEVSEGLSPYELDPYELGIGDLQDYRVDINNDVTVEGDEEGLTLTVNGERRARFVPVLSDRGGLYEALVNIGHDEPLSYALNAPVELLSICEHVAAAHAAAELWLPGTDDVTTPLDLDALPELTPAELEVARGLAPGWTSSISELLATAQRCVLAA